MSTVRSMGQAGNTTEAAAATAVAGGSTPGCLNYSSSLNNSRGTSPERTGPSRQRDKREPKAEAAGGEKTVKTQRRVATGPGCQKNSMKLPSQAALGPRASDPRQNSNTGCWWC